MTESQEYKPRKGLYFEEYATGQSFTSPGRTVTEADVVAFAALTGDWNAIHTDVVYAAAHPFGQRVAHGMLGLSIASGLAARLGMLEETVLAFREMRSWKFSLPIYLGDTVHARATIAETRAAPRIGGGMVTFDVELVNQRGEIVQHGEWSVLVMSRPDQMPDRS